MPSASSTSSASRSAGCSSTIDLVVALHQPDDDVTGGGFGRDPRGQLRGDERAGHQRAAELLEHEDRLGDAESEPAVVLGDTQREHAGVAQLVPELPVERAPACSMLRTTSGGKRPSQERADRLLERDLVVGELEVHGQRSRGRPSTRSPTMLRCTCDVPAAMLMRRAQKRAWT